MTQSIPGDWYTSFFTELPNEFWRRAVPEHVTGQEVDFVEQRLHLAQGSRVLDVPCGSGRHALALAARGHDVVGVDISAEAIDHARRAADRAGLPVELVLGDMRAIPEDGSFDAAVCMGNSFGYLDLDGTRQLVAALAAAVRPGGGLVIDYAAAAESVLPGFVDDQPRDITVGDITATGSNRYDVTNSRLISRYVFTRGAERVDVTALHHVLTVAQVRDLLTTAGFTDVACHGDLDGAPFQVGTGRLLVVARRG